MRRLRTRVFLSSLVIALAGCGGGGGNPPGRAWDVSIHWPSQTRGLEYAESIVVALELNGNSISTNIAERPSAGASTSKVRFALESAQTGTYGIRVSLKSGSSGGGATIGESVYAAASDKVDVLNVPADFSLNVVGDSIVRIGEEIQLHCDGAKNGSVVTVSPTLVKWVIATGGTGDGVVSPTGVFRATKAGTIRVQAILPDESGPELKSSLLITAH